MRYNFRVVPGVFSTEVTMNTQQTPQPQQVARGPRLRIDDLIGSVRIVAPGEEVIVGRAGDFRVGEGDLTLHRHLFQLWYGGQGWMISNIGSHIPLRIELRGVKGFSRIDLGPRAVAAVPPGPSRITFETPECPYELYIDVENSNVARRTRREQEMEEERTRTRHVPNDEQEELLRQLASYLKKPGSSDADIPSVREISDALEWTEKKTNHKMDRLVDSLKADGEKVYKPYKTFLAHYAIRHGR